VKEQGESPHEHTTEFEIWSFIFFKNEVNVGLIRKASVSLLMSGYSHQTALLFES
jgi:hypothetical protein